jgi:hypothetical protein
MILDDRQPVSYEAYHQGKTIFVDALLNTFHQLLV